MVVQQMLGHSSAAMTLDVNAGLFGDDLDSETTSTWSPPTSTWPRKLRLMRTRCGPTRTYRSPRSLEIGSNCWSEGGRPPGARTRNPRIKRVIDHGHCAFYLRLCSQSIIL